MRRAPARRALLLALVAGLLGCKAVPEREWILDFAYEGSEELSGCVVADLDPGREGLELGVRRGGGRGLQIARRAGRWQVEPAELPPPPPALAPPEDAPLEQPTVSLRSAQGWVLGDEAGRIAHGGPEGWWIADSGAGPVRALCILEPGLHPRIASAHASGVVLVAQLDEEPRLDGREVAHDGAALHALVRGRLPEIGDCLIACGRSGRVLVLTEKRRP